MTQNDMILRYLQSGKTLTGLEALHLFGTMKLATRISELKDEGHNISVETEHNPVTKKHYAKYRYIPNETLFVMPRKEEQYV